MKRNAFISMLTFVFMATLGCSQPKAAFVESQTEETTAETELDEVEYEQADSLEVMRLLADETRTTTLDYARYFIGRPYVAHTLDGAYAEGGDGKEKLVVNLRGLDCLTLLETCNALVLTRQQLQQCGVEDDAWQTYCRNLQSLRYFDGKIDGYASRLHYLTFSIADHLRRGTMEEVELPSSLTRQRIEKLHFMSRHPQYYDALKNDAAAVHVIDSLEQQYSGTSYRYLPQENCGLSRSQLDAIHDGDIIYIVTSKDGLDYAHQGYAFWEKGSPTGSGQSPRLHMLHASSDRKKVIADERPLSLYLQRIPSSIGIRVFRLK